MIKITTQGAETKEAKYGEGMSVKDALGSAGIELKPKATLTVNGKDAGVDDVVEDNAIIIITPNVSNG